MSPSADAHPPVEHVHRMSPTRTVLLAFLVTAPIHALAAQTPDERGSRLPCAVPLRWQVGSIDERFALDAAAVRSAAEEAAKVWQAASGETLFVQDTLAGFPIHLVWDGRQAALQSALETQEDLRREGAALDAERAGVEEAQAGLRASFAEHRERLDSFGARLASYNDDVRRWNERGGAPDSIRVALTRAGAGIEEERVSLRRHGDELDRLRDRLEARADELNRRIEDRNRRARAFMAGSLPRAAESGRYSESIETRNGRVTRVERRIGIFRFASRSALVAVLAHEMGHALGLDHAETRGALMSATVSVGRDGRGEPRLHPTDLALLEARCPELR
jgi:hypothetical protein